MAVLRSTQAQVIAEIVAARTRPNSAYIITGDMNDPPDSDGSSPWSPDGWGSPMH